MKKTIKNLKKLTGHRSDAKFAVWLGFTKNTIIRAKRGEKTKLGRVLPMLEYLITGSEKDKLNKFLKNFKKPD